MKRLLASLVLVVGCASAEFLPRNATTVDRSRSPASIDSTAPPFASTMPSVGVAAPLHAPIAKEGRLRNGIRVIMLEEHSIPLVALGITLARGSVDAAPGVFDLFMDSLTSGSDLISPKALRSTLYACAAQHDVRVLREHSRVEAQFVSPVIRDVVRMIAPTFATPTFDADTFTAMLDEHRRKLSRRADEPGPGAERALYKLLYPVGHPYAQDDTDGSTPLAGVTLDTIRTMRTFVGADDVAVVAVGDFSSDMMLALLEQTLGSLRVGARPRKTIEAPPPPAVAHVVAIDHPGDTQAQIALGFMGVKYDDPDYMALYCLSRIIRDRAQQSLRSSHGLTYGASSSMSMMRLPAPLVVKAAVNVQSVALALHDTFDALHSFDERLRDPHELQLIKNSILAVFPDTFDSVSEATSALETLAEFDLPVDAWVKMRAAVENMTADELVRVAKKYLDPQHAQLVVLGDVSRFKMDLDALGLGEVEVRRATH